MLKATMTLGALAFSAVALGQGQTVQWDADRATALGNGCPRDSYALIAAGNDLTILFSELGVVMPAGGGSALQEIKNCTIVVPAQVARGVYLADLEQSLNYSVQKTYGSEGRISTQSTFFNNPVSPIVRTHGQFEEQTPARDYNEYRVDSFLVNSPAWRFWCGASRALKGNLQTRIRSSGSRTSYDQGIELVANSQDWRFQVTASLQICSL
jgi:hypothetical protein